MSASDAAVDPRRRGFLALALAAGVAPATAARLSNIASGIAVRKLGTSTVSVRELAEAIEKSREEYTSK